MIDRVARAGVFTALLLCLFCGFARPANAWWNGDWSFRMKIEADAGPKGANIADPIGRR